MSHLDLVFTSNDRLLSVDKISERNQARFNTLPTTLQIKILEDIIQAREENSEAWDDCRERLVRE
jgi:hypothetical protein